MKIKTFFLLPFWGGIYYVSGVISQLLNDSYTSVNVVWFPAGVAIVALKNSPMWQWFVYFILFYILNQVIDTEENIHIEFVTNLLHLITPFLIATLSLYFVRFQFVANRVIIWLVAIVLTCGLLNAVAMISLKLMGDEINPRLFLSYWFADASGIIFAATIMDGLIKFINGKKELVLKRIIIWIISLTLLILTTWLIFSTHIGEFSCLHFKYCGQACIFLLAYIPLIFVIFIAIFGRNLGRFLSLSILGTIVIYCTYQRSGPFFLNGLAPFEPLIIAQCYLTSIAIILLLIYVFTSEYIPQNNDKHLLIRYELFPKEDKIIFDDVIEKVSSLKAKSTLTEVMSYLEPKEQTKLSKFWFKTIFIKNDVLTFKLNITLSHAVIIQDRLLMQIEHKNKTMLLGEWKVCCSELIKK